MKLIHFTGIGGTPVAVNPDRVIAVSENVHKQTVIVYGPETEQDYGCFTVDVSMDVAVRKLEERF